MVGGAAGSALAGFLYGCGGWALAVRPGAGLPLIGLILSIHESRA